jgi:hypothetical protein
MVQVAHQMGGIMSKETISLPAAQGLTLVTLCDMVMGEDAPDRSGQALIRATRKLMNDRDRWKAAYYAKEAYNDCLRWELNHLRRQLKELQP